MCKEHNLRLTYVARGLIVFPFFLFFSFRSPRTGEDDEQTGKKDGVVSECCISKHR